MDELKEDSPGSNTRLRRAGVSLLLKALDMRWTILVACCPRHRSNEQWFAARTQPGCVRKGRRERNIETSRVAFASTMEDTQMDRKLKIHGQTELRVPQFVSPLNGLTWSERWSQDSSQRKILDNDVH